MNRCFARLCNFMIQLVPTYNPSSKPTHCHTYFYLLTKFKETMWFFFLVVLQLIVICFEDEDINNQCLSQTDFTNSFRKLTNSMWFTAKCEWQHPIWLFKMFMCARVSARLEDFDSVDCKSRVQLWGLGGYSEQTFPQAGSCSALSPDSEYQWEWSRSKPCKWLTYLLLWLSLLFL